MKLKGFFLKRLTAGVAVKQVKYSDLCSNKGLLAESIKQCNADIKLMHISNSSSLKLSQVQSC